ncbi:MAG TPA: VWA domain-containing protein [Spirochaetota bacterium]|nr:VWA domain-containing protein [Spirochaetota bacterium]
MSFHNPELFFMFLLFPLIIFFYFWAGPKTSATLKFSTVADIKKIPPSLRLKFRHLNLLLLLAGLAFLIVAMAGPRSGKRNAVIRSEGIDIMLCLDISASMKGEDFKPNRLEAAKKVITSFIKKRNNDRIGLVVYGKEAYLQCPLTLDHNILINFVADTDFIPELQKATAVGMGVATSVYHLDKSAAKSKVLVLLTDGENNAGDIDPLTAAEMASTSAIKIYTVGMGTPGVSRIPITIDHPLFGRQQQAIQAKLNEKQLRKIASITDGNYFNARNRDNLEAVYKKIDRLEKTEIKSNQYYEYDEKFFSFLLTGFMLLLLYYILAHTLFRKLP